MIERFSIKQAGAVADTIANGTDVPVDGVIDLEVALQYGNHSSVQQYSAEIVQKIFDDVRFGTASIFPRNFAHTYNTFDSRLTSFLDGSSVETQQADFPLLTFCW